MSGLYVHIPFCARKCPYCAFYSLTEPAAIPAFLTALRLEMALRRREGETFETLYIGGGTPSLLKVGQIAALFADLRASFHFVSGAEITFEANPADVTADQLTALRDAGVNRINLGIQSLDEGDLAFLGRRHDGAQARDAVAAAAASGFDHLGLDLVYALPGQPPRRWLAMLHEAADLPADHLSCYQLTVETGTPLAERIGRGETVLPPEEVQAELFLQTSDLLEARGYHHYEVSNFARPGGASRHNQHYWDHTPYLGLGPAAHSFDGRVRRWNHRSLDAYLADLAAGRPPTAGMEVLDAEALRLEALFLGLRTRQGIHLERFRERYGEDLLAEKGETLARLAEAGLVVMAGGWLRPTRSGLAVADSLALI